MARNLLLVCTIVLTLYVHRIHAEEELHCRIEILTPQMGDVLLNEEAALEYQVVECVDLPAVERVVIELDGAEIAQFEPSFMSISLRSIKSGHHSVFIYIQPCTMCVQRVNSSVFFTTRSASSSVLDPQVAAMVTNRSLHQYFLGTLSRPSHSIQLTPRSEFTSAEPYSGSMSLHSLPARGRLMFAAGDLVEAVSLMQLAATRIQNQSRSRSDEDLLDTCIHYHQALVMLKYAEKQGRPVNLGEACQHHLSVIWPLPRESRGQEDVERVGYEDVAYGVVSGHRMYRTRARAVAETW
eukprot:758823-Hanusia_phi.AAC.1